MTVTAREELFDGFISIRYFYDGALCFRLLFYLRFPNEKEFDYEKI